MTPVDIVLARADHALTRLVRATPVTLKPGDTCLREANQPHQIKTGDRALLALVLWCGAGFAGIPRKGLS